jgi:hypothetical protein
VSQVPEFSNRDFIRGGSCNLRYQSEPKLWLGSPVSYPCSDDHYRSYFKPLNSPMIQSLLPNYALQAPSLLPRLPSLVIKSPSALPYLHLPFRTSSLENRFHWNQTHLTNERKPRQPSTRLPRAESPPRHLRDMPGRFPSVRGGSALQVLLTASILMLRKDIAISSR